MKLAAIQLALLLDEYMTLWGEPDGVHMQNIEQLNAYDCHQNVTEPRTTEYRQKKSHMYMNLESGLATI